MDRCSKCGSQKILKNDVQECIFCVGKKQGVAKPGYAPVVDPGEAGLQKVLNGQKGTRAKTMQPVTVRKLMGTAEDALIIMQSLPMPNDIKQFKKIQKIIKQLQTLVEE